MVAARLCRAVAFSRLHPAHRAGDAGTARPPHLSAYCLLRTEGIFGCSNTIAFWLQFGRGEFEPEFAAHKKLGMQCRCYRFAPSLKADMEAASLVISHAGMRMHSPASRVAAFLLRLLLLLLLLRLLLLFLVFLLLPPLLLLLILLLSCSLPAVSLPLYPCSSWNSYSAYFSCSF